MGVSVFVISVRKVCCTRELLPKVSRTLVILKHPDSRAFSSVLVFLRCEADGWQQDGMRGFRAVPILDRRKFFGVRLESCLCTHRKDQSCFAHGAPAL